MDRLIASLEKRLDYPRESRARIARLLGVSRTPYYRMATQGQAAPPYIAHHIELLLLLDQAELEARLEEKNHEN